MFLSVFKLYFNLEYFANLCARPSDNVLPFSSGLEAYYAVQ